MNENKRSALTQGVVWIQCKVIQLFSYELETASIATNADIWGGSIDAYDQENTKRIQITRSHMHTYTLHNWY